MGNPILDVVLGLVLIYLVLSLLSMKLQETLDGLVFKGRVRNLHRLVCEAVGGDTTLRNRVMQSPLIFALYQGDTAKGHTWWRSSGPSRIPPDLFARAILGELNGGNQPSAKFATPTAFLGGADHKTGNARVWATMDALVVGQEASWPGFEKAIADWFRKIGDRSDGWFKRRAQIWSLVMGALVAMALNADSFNLARVLSTDGQVREALADLARRVDAQHEQSNSEASTKVVQTPAAQPATVRVGDDLADAMRRTSALAKGHTAFGSFAILQEKFPPVCEPFEKYVLTAPPATVEKERRSQTPSATPPEKAASASVATNWWLRVLMNVRSDVTTAHLPCDLDDKTAVCSAPSNRSSNGDALRASQTYHQATRCLQSYDSWLVNASVLSGADADTTRDLRASLRLAVADLEELDGNQRVLVSLRRSFLNDPQAFKDCAADSSSRAAFDACLVRETAQSVRLPLLFLDSTLKPQFCRVETPANASSGVEPGNAKPDSRAEPHFPCGGDLAQADPALGLESMWTIPIQPNWFARWGLWLAGILVTTMFVALGAPFWFDVLGRVVRLRAAGDPPAPSADSKKEGTPSTPVAGSSPAPRVDASAPGTGPFADSRNRFEDGLVTRDVIALQQARGVPATGRLDQPTRAAILAFTVTRQPPGTEELSRELYYQIVGRDAVQVGAVVPQGRLVLGRADDKVPAVAAALMKLDEFSGRIAPTETVFSNEVRALAVLYEYKKEMAAQIKANAGGTVFDNTLQIVTTSRSSAASLDEMDPAAVAEVLGNAGPPFDRETSPWLDWALGEQGQVALGAKSIAASNARVCEYLKVASPGSESAGDTTPWCGAFAAWCLNRHADTLAAGDAMRTTLIPSPAPANWPLRAASWADWGKPIAQVGNQPDWTKAQRGDIVLFKPASTASGSSSGHVAFFLAVDTGGGRVVVIGGDQTASPRVIIESFPISDVVNVLRA